MTRPIDRWILPDLKRAVNWYCQRNSQGLRCILGVLGENARSPQKGEIPEGAPEPRKGAYPLVFLLC